MPLVVFVVALLLVVFYGIGLRLLTAPVSPTRLDGFVTRYSLDPTDTRLARLQVYLAVRRRSRVVGVLVAATVGFLYSIPDNRLQFNFALMLAGWLVGATAAEWVQRRKPDGFTQLVSVPRWWGQTRVATSVITVLGIVAAVLLRSDGVPLGPLLGWAAAAVAAVAAASVAVGQVKWRCLRDADDADAAAATIDAVRGLTIGAVALMTTCLGIVWTQAVPGPYGDAPEIYPLVWLGAIALATFMVFAAGPATSDSRPSRLWWAVAIVVALPMAWAVPMRLAQIPPLTAQEVQPSARVWLARYDRVQAARAELGLTPDLEHNILGGDPAGLPQQLIGRVDLAQPAPEGSHFEVLAFDRRTNTALTIYGADGSGWYGGWSRILAARYPWLAQPVGPPGQHGLFSSPHAVWEDPSSGVLWFHMTLLNPGKIAAEDVQVVLMLIGPGSYIFWATPVVSTTSNALA